MITIRIWKLGHMVCRVCGYFGRGVFMADTNEKGYECPRCGQRTVDPIIQSGAFGNPVVLN